MSRRPLAIEEWLIHCEEPLSKVLTRAVHLAIAIIVLIRTASESRPVDLHTRGFEITQQQQT